jgi:hypothetical protein
MLEATLDRKTAYAAATISGRAEVRYSATICESAVRLI